MVSQVILLSLKEVSKRLIQFPHIFFIISTEYRGINCISNAPRSGILLFLLAKQVGRQLDM